MYKRQTPDGKPVENAEVTVSGGMPMHNHGLPTAPQVTKELSPGQYLVEGLKFQMGGRWEVSFEINANDTTDSATFKLKL